MKQALNALFAKIGVRLVRMGVWMKRPLGSLQKLYIRRLQQIFVVVIKLVAPAYRIFRLVKRSLKRFIGSSKNKLMAFTTHRHVIHVIVAGIVFSIVFLNMQTTQVRAETFGEGSQMYRLVAGERQMVLEEYAITPEQLETSLATGALDGTALSAFNRGIDSPLVVGGVTNQSDTGAFSSGLAISIDDSTLVRKGIQTYLVKEGDIIGSIAEKFGISVETILWANNLTERTAIRPGDELTILPVTGVTHTVKSGDSLSLIASTYGVTLEDILETNEIDEESLKLGLILIIPGGSPPSTSPNPPSLPGSPSNPSPGGMIWPTDLYLITQQFSSWTHSGIDIDCHFTHKNYAAASGTVTYAGWRNGYGNTVEISHGGGLTTRYAHHASLAVITGQQVSQGQALGICGTTGRSTGTHLHFEVMINGAFQNPLTYIR